MSDPGGAAGARLRRNVVSNYAGNFWTAAMALATLPVYVRFLGIAGFGLVGFFVALQSLVSLFDAGLSTSVNKELARAEAIGRDRQIARDVVRTAEILYWGLALVIGAALVLIGPAVAHYWIRSGILPTEETQWAVVLMGLAIALEFPLVLYTGGLLGLQRQVTLNVLVGLFATLRSGGAVLVLWLVSPTIEAFFCWQAAVSLAQSVTTAVVLWRCLGGGTRPRFSKSALSRISGFSARLAIIGVLSALLTQLPRLELSKILTLRDFGYFSVASVVAAGLYYFTTPVFAAVFPRLTELSAQGNRTALTKLYHQSCQMVSIVVFPVALVLVLFSRQILLVWTQDADVSRHASLLVGLLVVGTTFHALCFMPYALQLAEGWTKLALWQNTIAVVVMVPLTLFLSVAFGAAGAAVAWIALSAGYLGIGVQVMHSRLLPAEKTKWVVADLLSPLMGAAAVVIAARLLFSVGPATGSLWLIVSCVGLVVVAAEVAAAWFSPVGRAWLRSHFPATVVASNAG